MKSYAKAAICGVTFALAGLCTAQADEATATSAPMSLIGTNPPHATKGAVIPYAAHTALPAGDTPVALSQPVAASYAPTSEATLQSGPPPGMRITYKRAANGSFVKTYVAETGTN